MKRKTARRGVSLMEVLISTFVLAIGLLGLASLIPVARLAVVETGKCDRGAACGRAALREIKIRRMLESSLLSPNPGAGPFTIDPLGVASGGPSLGLFPRVSLLDPVTGAPLTPAQIERIFTWQDDLVFDKPADVTLRPSEPAAGLQNEGHYSWYANVIPAGDGVTFVVSAVVCYRRDMQGGQGTQDVVGTYTATIELDAPPLWTN